MKIPLSFTEETGLPVVALIGASNVGKSSLFNCLTVSRTALVAPEAGFTRDRQYGVADCAGVSCLISDSCGLDVVLPQLADFSSPTSSPAAAKMLPAGVTQSLKAINEAQLVLLVADARAPCTAVERELAGHLRTLGKPTLLVLNKVDGVDEAAAQAEFFCLALGAGRCVSALHQRGLGQLRNTIAARLGPVLPPPTEAPAEQPEEEQHEEQKEEQEDPSLMSVAVVGRPNVGKSTLINLLLDSDRMVVADQPGTTRDSVQTVLYKNGRRCILIDTAGVRRRSRSKGAEKLCALRALRYLREARVALLLLDGTEGVTEQDLRLLSLAQESGRVQVLAINKSDLLDDAARRQLRATLRRRLHTPAQIHHISARSGAGVNALWRALCHAHDDTKRSLHTPQLTRILRRAVTAHPLPAPGRYPIKLRYAHPGGNDPLTVVVHGNQAEQLPPTYRRYLENYFRRALRLETTPIQLLLRNSNNPYTQQAKAPSPSRPPKQPRRRPHPAHAQ